MNLLNFLQQSIGSVSGVPETEALEEETIEVQGGNIRRPEAGVPVYNDAPPRGAIDPRYVLNDDRIAPTRQEMKEILPREGNFGVKGTLRDILGIVGDAFLVQSGNKSVYQPQRQQEKMGDFMYGFTQNPQQAMERMAGGGFTKEAGELQDNYTRQGIAQGQLNSQEAARKSQAQDREYTNELQARTQIARWMQNADTPSKQAYALQLSKQLADRLGVPLSKLGLPDDGTLTEDQRMVLGDGDVTTNQMRNMPLKERQVKVQERGAASREISAAAADRNSRRPRASARPRADTDLEFFREVSNIPAGERTPEQTAWMGKYLKGTKGGRAAGVPPPPGQVRPKNRLRLLPQ